MQFAIMIMVTGALIAGATDLTYSVPGYIWVAVCAVSTAVYLLLIRLLKDKTGEDWHPLCTSLEALRILASLNPCKLWCILRFAEARIMMSKGRPCVRNCCLACAHHEAMRKGVLSLFQLPLAPHLLKLVQVCHSQRFCSTTMCLLCQS